LSKVPNTPLMRQYLEMKGRHPDAILFFQVGDFYEMFYEDAEEASRLLNLTLTSRNNGEAANVPLAGVPIKAAQDYVQRLIRMGRRVAICQQVEDAAQARGLVRREVVETVTPGAVFSDELLSASQNNFLAAVAGSPDGGPFGLAWSDVSTGEFVCAVVPGSELNSELERIDAREVVLPRSWEGGAGENGIGASSGRALAYREDWCFDLEIAGEGICRHFGIKSLASLGLAEPGDEPAVRAAGALLGYLLEVQPGGGSQLRAPRAERSSALLHMDEMTRRNLEVVRPLRPDLAGTSLLDVLDSTLTPMAARLLRSWLLRPLAEPSAIRERLDAVEELFDDAVRRKKVRESLRTIRDLERLAARAGAARATPRDLLGLAQSLRQVPEVLEAMGEPGGSRMLTGLLEGLDRVDDVADLIERAIDPEAPPSLTDGGVVRPGYSAELDELRSVRDGAVEWIAELQGRERQRTGIASLKVGYNKVFGYYIEVTKPNLSKVPDDYQRRQTLTGAERFITPELKDWESKVLSAEERITDLEQGLFRDVRDTVAAEVHRLQDLAKRIALIDVIATLAYVAERNGFVRPAVDDEYRIEIHAGRHPVVETMMPREQFVPNDVRLDGNERVIVLTGPNMAGKSTILRQVGLITLLAQMGSFVPAGSAKIGVADRIFTRVGASDNLPQGHSTFMVEMIETAAILNGATERSLILLDEIGRGTSTYDGVSIAWAVTEHIHERIGAKTIFATHYHELTLITDLLPSAVAYNVAVKEVGDQIVFLRHLEPGGADRSYGVQVARLAGLPREVLERARQILRDLERGDGDLGPLGRRGRTPESVDRSQLSLFTVGESPLLERLRSLDPEAMTPLEALALLAELKREAEEA
jgi:DNA mismatch repair protein MutS